MGASGTSLVEMIQQETSARTEGDEDIWNALNQEISARTEGDNDLWDALNAVILQKSKNNYLLEKNLLNEPLLYMEIITTILKLNIMECIIKFV